MKRLRTADQVVEVLGGLQAVCELTGANSKQAWHWTGRAGMFPANTYVAMTRALNRRGYEAPARLWNMKGIERAA
jgi:hypothetical protein